MNTGFLGKRIGKYELIERLGRGGMAEVYKAHQSTLDRHVAIKVLHPFLGEDPEFKTRFESEARTVAKLHHPNIVQVFDFDFDPQRELYYMVMELIDGPTLKTHLYDLGTRGEIMGVNEALKITRDVGKALSYAHKRGMIHRDVKPGNVMIDKDGRVVLTDFGIARIVSGPNMTASGSMVGTPTYMAPEQGLGQSGDHRADIYSLGVLLYQLTTGTVPFEADTPVAVVLKHVNEALPAPSDRNPEIPEAVERIIYKALAKAPENRYQEVDDFVNHLDSLIVSTTLILDRPKNIANILEETTLEMDIPDGYKEDNTDIFVSGTIRRTSCLGLLAAVAIALLAMAAGIYLAYTGLISTFTPIEVETSLVLTPTPQLPISTQAEFGQLEIDATIQAMEISNSLDGTLQPTATCSVEYDILSRTPEQGGEVTENSTLEQRIVITNSGDCDIPAGAAFELVEGEDATERIEIETIEPGAATELLIEIDIPAFDDDDNERQYVWEFVVNGERVSPDLVVQLTVTE